MASIVLLLSELLGGESASVLEADRYMRGHQSLGQFRPAVTEAAAKAGQDERAAGGHCAADTRCTRCEEESTEESFEDLAASRIEVDVMWP